MDQPRLNLPFVGVPTFLRAPQATDLETLDADIAILGVPSDEGSPWYPGARMAPRRIREMSLRYAEYGGTHRPRGFYDLNEDRRYLEGTRVVDCGDIDIIYTNPAATMDNVTAGVEALLRAGALPVILGGDHAISWGAARAYTEPLTLVHFDAHLDYRPFSHGADYGNGSPVRKMASLPHIQHIVQVGMRSLRMSQDDLTDARAAGNDIITMRRYRSQGIADLLERIPAKRPVYLSIDIDVLDMPLVPGCASAEPDGFAYADLTQALFAITAHTRIAGFDIVEVNPLLDTPSNPTSLLAAQLAVETMGHASYHSIEGGNR